MTDVLAQPPPAPLDQAYGKEQQHPPETMIDTAVGVMGNVLEVRTKVKKTLAGWFGGSVGWSPSLSFVTLSLTSI